MAYDGINEEETRVSRDIPPYPTKKSLEARPEIVPIDDIEMVRGPLEKEATAGPPDSQHDESPWVTLPKWRKSLVLLWYIRL